jgi:hypothetical protein
MSDKHVLTMIVWKLRCFVYRMRENTPMWIAYRLPNSVVYWCAIRVGAHATCGPWGNESPTELLAMTALERWRKQ